MTFEPTEIQHGVDPNMFTLIDPGTIPYPLTDVWSLNYAAETLRTGGENLSDGAEDMRSTWQGLQAHYTAPESETLFAKMDPVTTRAEDVQSDLSTVATALEDLAEAAKTARSALNLLRIDAQGFWNRHHDKKVWWLTKDEETDQWALGENIRIKDAVNAAWATFNEAENDCASRISSVFGGPAYVSPGQGGGDNTLVYGLPPDAGERDVSLERALSFEGANSNLNDLAAWVGTEFHPSQMSWRDPADQAVWDTVVTDALWGSAVGLVSKLGYWHADNGWRLDPTGRWDNAKAAWNDAKIDASTLIGIHDEHGWLWKTPDGGQEGSTWDRWLTNLDASKDELVEGHTAWSTRDEGTGYSNGTMGANAALLTVGLPLKGLKTVLGAGVGGDRHTPSTGSDGSGSHAADSRGGPGTNGWPSSPLPQRSENETSTTERFDHQLTVLKESLLDPDRFRPNPPGRSDTPSPTPDTGGDQPFPKPQESGTPPQRSGNEGSRDQSDEVDTGRPGSPGEKPEASMSPRPESEVPRGEEHRSPRRDEEDGGDQGDTPVQNRGDDQEGTKGLQEESEGPEPATGGAGGGGGDEPPRDRRSTGGDGEERSDGPTGGDDVPSADPPQPPGSPEKPPHEPNRDDGDGGNGGEGKEGESTLTPDPRRPEYLPPDTARMDPGLGPQVLEALKNTPGVRQLNLTDAKLQQIIDNLKNRPYGQQVAEMILSGPVTEMRGFSGIVSDLKNARGIESKNQEMRLALDIYHSGVPADRVEFRGKDMSTGEDLDVAVLGSNGDTLRGYQAYIPEPGAANPVKSAMKKFRKQLPYGTDTANQVGVMELRMNRGDIPESDIRKMEEFAEERGLSVHLNFQDETIVLPHGTQMYMEGN
ncbi:hypothetical protein VSQ78_03765 [Nocardiopsis alba]|uniref:Uncharacterized protein n=1 Tax=Nocardiopsis alba TaxID=53437 RepID=A0ABV5DQE7_9ACTN